MKSRALLTTVVACLLVANNIQAQTHPHPTRNRLPDGSPEAMMTEVIVRPMSLVGSLLGGAIHIITWPFAALGEQSTKESRRQLIDKPLEATFKRPLGNISRLKEINRGTYPTAAKPAKTVPLTVIEAPKSTPATTGEKKPVAAEKK